jgi:hypothetical protein
MKFVVVLFLGGAMLMLVRRNLLQIDLTFPLFAGLVVLGFASMSEGFIDWAASVLNIVDAPRAIVLIAIAILFSIITVLAIAHSQLRRRQLMIIRYLAQNELMQQETRAARN